MSWYGGIPALSYGRAVEDQVDAPDGIKQSVDPHQCNDCPVGRALCSCGEDSFQLEENRKFDEDDAWRVKDVADVESLSCVSARLQEKKKADTALTK